ncbi:MAG: hypothetical protein ACYDHZ_10810 [Dehalococcoidia bacterium]
MNQPGTGTERAETGEKEPKGATSSDRSGEKKVGLKGGVGMGKADGGSRPADMGKHDGRLGEHNDGKKGEREVYSHVRTPHEQDGY